ncbi:MAG TPA: signal peptide peptidase SppA [Polyangiaceae bacterium]|jgi:protease-4|nr:signal peptide peptidase SppA [Polyangiaceae bacterium]
MKRVLACAALALFAMPAGAQVPPRASDGVVTPSQPLASTDDASAIFVNPANLAFGAGPEARFSMIHTGDRAPHVNQGYAVEVGLPFWILATGLRVDWMTPPDSAPRPFADNGRAHDYSWVRWGNSVRLGDLASLGITIAWSSAETARLDGLFAASSGLTLRPNRFLSAAVVGRDWNTPSNETGQTIEPSLDIGLNYRPLGHRMLEIGLEGSYRSDVERWVPAANLGVDIPFVGRLRGGAQLVDPNNVQVVASALLDVNLFDYFQVGGGPVFGTAIPNSDLGFALTAAVRTFTEKPRVPILGRVVRLRFEATPDTREHVRLLRTLWRLSEDPEIDGVLMEMRTEPAESLAHAEELVDAIKLLRRRGKKVFCHLEDAGGRELFVCSAADRIAINPAGGLRFAGLSTRYFYFGGLLDKLGVRADFVRIGAHKTAPEQFTPGPSETAVADHRELLTNIDKVYVGQIASGRGMSLTKTRRNIERGPFIAAEARDAHLIDVLAYEDEIERFVEEAMGTSVNIEDYDPPTEAPPYWRPPPKIAIVYLRGEMVDGQSRHIPILDIYLAGSYTIAKALKEAREDSSVKAVVFRIETGGGSSLAADVILREAILTAKAKPLVVSMGSVAASGGYYAAVAGNEIFANRSTVTGSIGIFYGKVDVVGLLDKVGVRVESMRTAPRADAESFFRPFTDEERVELGKKVKQFYDLFIGRVAEGRHMKPDRVHAIAQGKVWTGEQAHARGLVDHIGGLRQALAEARRLADLAPDAPIVELPVEEPTLFELILEFIGVPSLKAEANWVPPPIDDVARALVPFIIYHPYKPLARMEEMIVGP